MANPPFNVDFVDPDRIKGDERLPFGHPGLSQKTGTASNANYLWIQYFYSYLNDRGRAGFVMAGSAADAGHGEKRIREDLNKTGAVDAVVAIGMNFFYTRYQAINAACNQETDCVTIEQTFAELLGVIAGMSEEERRAVRDGLSQEEHLAVYDLLCRRKEDLTSQACKRAKAVAQELVAAVRAEIAAIHAWRANEITQAQVRSLIYDFLYDERTGLPDAYAPEEIEPLSGEVYRHVFVQFGGARAA